jgi:hypothetical protein
MNVLVDTCIWSLALRREHPENHIQLEILELTRELRLRIIGPIRQEVLSGIRNASQFEKTKGYLAAFADLLLETEDFEKAAEFFNLCQRNGIQGSNTDFLICSVAYRGNLEIFTSDNDFTKFQKHIPINLYSPRLKSP